MEKKDHKAKFILGLIFILILGILLFVTFCSKKAEPEGPSDKNNPPAETPTGSKSPESSGFMEVNKPALLEGMTAIKWENNDWVDVKDPDKDTTWYDYSKKTGEEAAKWANARTADGSYWVWIPRFAYKISQEKVDIIFLQNKTTLDKNSEEISNDYIVHPAFSSNVEQGGWNEEITGFWVSKFEAAKNENGLVFLPNTYSYNNITIGEAYTLSKSLPYENAFPHLIKNSEWGAVAYLATSPYGRDGVEVSANLTKTTLADGTTTSVTAGGNGTDGLASTPQDALENNKDQSTTGNIYGVYDMAGGLWERVAAYIHNGNDNLLLNGKSMVEEGDPKSSNAFKTVYAYNAAEDTNEANYNANKSRGGDAMFETSSGVGYLSWYGDESSFMFGNAVFLHRGGTTLDNPGVGIFTFSNTPGMAGNPLGFRSTIIVK